MHFIFQKEVAFAAGAASDTTCKWQSVMLFQWQVGVQWQQYRTFVPQRSQ